MSTPFAELIATKVQALSPEKQQEVLDFLALIEPRNEPPRRLRSAYGLWKDMGIDISKEDIDQLRREMWGNFPRDDF